MVRNAKTKSDPRAVPGGHSVTPGQRGRRESCSAEWVLIIAIGFVLSLKMGIIQRKAPGRMSCFLYSFSLAGLCKRLPSQKCNLSTGLGATSIAASA